METFLICNSKNIKKNTFTNYSKCLNISSSREWSDRLRIPRSTLDSDWTLKWSLKETTWYENHVVCFRLHTCSIGLPRRTAISLFTNHNVTACQSTRGHSKRTQNPCQQSLYNMSDNNTPQDFRILLSIVLDLTVLWSRLYRLFFRYLVPTVFFPELFSVNGNMAKLSLTSKFDRGLLYSII